MRELLCRLQELCGTDGGKVVKASTWNLVPPFQDRLNILLHLIQIVRAIHLDHDLIDKSRVLQAGERSVKRDEDDVILR